jgi:Holliday junction resolvase RusA-like endonuclease
MRINIKPLSTNSAWMGRRFKTQKYIKYEKDLLFLLPKINIPEGKLQIDFIVGYSSVRSDIDNFCKQTIDCMQKKYGFNDSRIYRLVIEKQIVKKGEEFIDFEIKKYL